MYVKGSFNPAASIIAVGCVVLLAVGCSRNATARSSAADATGGAPALARRQLPADQNAFPLWTNAIVSLKEQEIAQELRRAFTDVCTFRTNTALAEVSGPLTEWRDANQEAFGLMVKALALGRLQFPPLKAGSEGDAFLGLSGWIKLANAKTVAGRLCAARGAFEEAGREFAGVCRLGQQMAEGEGALVFYLLGTGIRGKGLSALRRLCSEEAAPVAVLRDLLTGLPSPPAKDAGLALTCGVEKELLRKALRDFPRASNGSVFSRIGLRFRVALVFDVKATAELSQRVHAQVQTNALCASWAACDRRLLGELKARTEVEGLDEFEDGVSDWGRWLPLQKAAFRTPNIFGERAVYFSARAAESALLNSFRVRTQVNLTRAFIALRIMRKDTGAYPAALDETVACGLLPDVPVDFFDGKPLRYSREQRLLWSVNENGVDDGGAERKDLVVRLPE